MNSLSFIPLGGIGDVTKNMYLYELADQILIVDCGLGFPDETMLGVDLLLPDISYLKTTKKRIAGMVITHGHEDHVGALPFILPNLPKFPVFATNMAATFANEKLKEFKQSPSVQKADFNKILKLGDFEITFIRVTHSIPDTSHIFIKTPAGNFYHGSDFKFDPSPYDGKLTDFEKIKEAGREGVTALFSDSLGSERQGRTRSESELTANFEREIKNCKGKFIVTTYSSNIARLNQVIEASEKVGRKVCFIGRSLLKMKEIGKQLGYLKLKAGTEINIEQIKSFKDSDLTLIIAGSQGQEESAMTRAANDEVREVKLRPNDTVVFSADPIPGYEIYVYEVIDTITKKDVKVIYSSVSSDFHVSGHGSQDELSDLIKLLNPKKLVPISGGFRHMYAYKSLALKLGFKREDILLPDNGLEIIFDKKGARFGRKFSSKNVYVDNIGGEMESFVLMDRQRLSEGGIVIVLAEVDSNNGQLIADLDIITRGISLPVKTLNSKLTNNVKKALSKRKGRVTNWSYIRKLIGQFCERVIFHDLRARPLVLPVVIEV